MDRLSDGHPTGQGMGTRGETHPDLALTPQLDFASTGEPKFFGQVSFVGVRSDTRTGRAVDSDHGVFCQAGKLFVEVGQISGRYDACVRDFTSDAESDDMEAFRANVDADGGRASLFGI